jgi:RNA polymerase-interacting CarD/CdnL/TRCF family regulator
MKHGFKIGDKVCYAVTGALGWEDIDEAEQGGLMVGQPCTIIEVDIKDNSVRVAESVCDTWMSALHFLTI